MPLSLQHLDLLLITVRKVQRIQQDGISFQVRCYFDVTLATYVGEDVLIRYDPSDMAVIRVYYRDTFLCRAVCVKPAGETVSLKEITWARTQQHKQVLMVLRDRTKTVKDALGPVSGHQEPQELVPPHLFQSHPDHHHG